MLSKPLWAPALSGHPHPAPGHAATLSIPSAHGLLCPAHLLPCRARCWAGCDAAAAVAVAGTRSASAAAAVAAAAAAAAVQTQQSLLPWRAPAPTHAAHLPADAPAFHGRRMSLSVSVMLHTADCTQGLMPLSPRTSTLSPASHAAHSIRFVQMLNNAPARLDKEQQLVRRIRDLRRRCDRRPLDVLQWRRRCMRRRQGAGPADLYATRSSRQMLDAVPGLGSHPGRGQGVKVGSGL